MATISFRERNAPNMLQPEVPFPKAKPRFFQKAGPRNPPQEPGFKMPNPTITPTDPGEDGMAYLHGSAAPAAGGTTVSNYWNDPMLQQYTDFATQAMQRLSGGGGPNPYLQDAISKLNHVFTQGNAGYEQFKTVADRRLEQLKTPLYGMGSATDSPDAMQNSALLRAKFLEPMVQQRDASQRQALERASSRGLGMTSGLTEELARGVDTQFNQQMAQGYRDLMLQEVQANEGREKEAVGIGQLLASLAGGGGQAAGQMAGIGQNLQGEDIRNLMSGVGISQSLAQMPMQNMMSVSSLMNSLNGQPVPQADSMNGIMQLLASLAGQGENSMNNAMNQEGNFWGSIFGQLPAILQNIPGVPGKESE